jgi:predicted metal-dependent peptidase
MQDVMSIVEEQSMRIKKAHIALMRQPSTALYSGVLLMGKNEVIEGNFTAYTDGLNKRYCAQFLATLSDPEVRALVLHENLHVALNQLLRGKHLFEESRQLANIAADFVVNGIICNIRVKLQGTEEPLLRLPAGGVFDPMFNDWSFPEVFAYLKQHCQPKNSEGSGNPKPSGQGDSEGNQSPDSRQDSNQSEKNEITVNGQTHDLTNADEHDIERAQSMDAEAVKKQSKQIEDALRQGGILAGRLGAKMPRAITEALESAVSWQDVLREFVSSHTKGKDEYTWRRYNRRLLANDLYIPSVMNETVGEIVVAIDTSGSIGQKQLNEMATELASICEMCEPETVRVLWWDTKVHSEQKFLPEQYHQIRTLLKPEGGGGTRVSCVADYIGKNKIPAECVVVFTDGYVENSPQWTITIPTLWLVTENRHFTPPAGGRSVRMEK